MAFKRRNTTLPPSAPPPDEYLELDEFPEFMRPRIRAGFRWDEIRGLWRDAEKHPETGEWRDDELLFHRGDVIAFFDLAEPDVDF